MSIDPQFLQDAGSGALGCGGRIVEFVSQIARQLAQRIQLLRLLLHPRHFAHAIQKDAHHRSAIDGMALSISGNRDRSNSSPQVGAEV